MAEKPQTLRVSQETMDDFRKIAKENFDSQDEAMEAILKIYKLDQASSTEYGTKMKLDINTFRRYMDGMLELFTASVNRGAEATQAAENKLRNRIESSETAVTTIKSQNEKLSRELAMANTRINEYKNQLSEKEKLLTKSLEESEKAKKSADAWNKSIETLMNQLDEYKAKADDYDKVIKKLNTEKAELIDKNNDMTRELAKFQAQVEAYKGILNTYTPKKDKENI